MIVTFISLLFAFKSNYMNDIEEGERKKRICVVKPHVRKIAIIIVRYQRFEYVCA